MTQRNCLDEYEAPPELGEEGVAVLTLARSLGVFVGKLYPDWYCWGIPCHPDKDVAPLGGSMSSPYECAADAIRLLSERGYLRGIPI